MIKPKLKEQWNMEALRAPVLRDIGMSLLLLLASRASVLGMFPFGIAFFAACFDKSIAYLGITAMAVAMLTTAGSTALMKYIIAALVFWIYTRFSQKDNHIIDASVCGASVVAGGLAFLLYGFVGFYDILMLFIEAITASIMYIIFKKSYTLMRDRKKRANAAQDELISLALSIGVIITGLSGINLPYSTSLANIVSVYAVMCIALHSSLAAAGSGGVCIGFMSAMSSPMAIVTMGIYGMSALGGNLLKAFGRFGVALGFLGGSAVALLYAGNTYTLPVTLIETSIGALLFMLTPNKAHNAVGAVFSRSIQIEPLLSDVRVKEYLSLKLEKTAGAFKSLEECFENASEKRLKAYNKDVASLFDEVADRVCEGCPNAPKCWQSDFTRTYRSIMTLLDTIETRGILTLTSVPVTFREKCLRCELFVVEFNHVYELYKKNLVYMGEAVTGRDLVASQYREMSQLLHDMSEEITEGFSFKEDREEEIVDELGKIGINVFEISVIESGHGKMEVYLDVDKSTETGKIENVLESVLCSPMMFDRIEAGGLSRFTSRAKFSAEIALRQKNRDFSEVSGDSADSFTTDDYKHYVILSDGMGSGKRAMAESHITLKLLREFLQSGFNVKTAIDMINSALCLRLDYECFSTVDLLCIDLMTGVCEFYKIGGAESIVLHSTNVETVFSVSLPVGMMSEIKVQSQTKRLADGDTIIMMTDGVSEAGFGTVRTEWLKKEIKIPRDTMDELAEAVINTAVKKSRDAVVDDMTVVAIRLAEN